MAAERSVSGWAIRRAMESALMTAKKSVPASTKASRISERRSSESMAIVERPSSRRPMVE